MTDKITQGWALYRPANGDLRETWIYSRSGMPWKTKAAALKEKAALQKYFREVELHEIRMFHEKVSE